MPSAASKMSGSRSLALITPTADSSPPSGSQSGSRVRPVAMARSAIACGESLVSTKSISPRGFITSLARMSPYRLWSG
jgi:hypothetical protein